MPVLASGVRVQPITHEIVVAAVILRRRHALSHWDATILSAAAALGCSTVYSEDMSDGGLYDGVRVVNPFRESAMDG
jgi:predicted nucleic acid-binding protein